MNDSMKWLDEVRGTDSIREVARRIGSTHSTLARQVNTESVTFETVRDIARSYARPVIADLITTGHLTHEDAGTEGIERSLQAATDEQLTLEVGRRLGVTSASTLWDAPVSQAVDAAARAQATVHDLDELRHGGKKKLQDDLKAVASERGKDEGFDGDYDA